MYKKDLSKLPDAEKEKEAKIQQIQEEIDSILDQECGKAEEERLFYLIDQLDQLQDIPSFDVERGWKEFKEKYQPEVEMFKRDLKKIEFQKKTYQKFILKRIMSIAFVIIFTIILAGAVIGRTGFVNYFSCNTQEMEIISDKSSEEIQRDLQKEYQTLEKEYGVKIAKLNLPSEEYTLQDYTLDKKYIGIIYFNLNTTERVVFSIYKNKQSSGKINVENSEEIETYLHKDIEYTIIKNMERYYIFWEKEGVYYVLQNCSSLEECKTMIKNITY